MRKTALTLAAGMLGAILAGPAVAATCHDTESFGSWLQKFKHDALAQGISPQVMAEAAPELVYDPSVIRRDRGHIPADLPRFLRPAAGRPAHPARLEPD
jgi:membrane-bound lytic murein transglycosylase B